MDLHEFEMVENVVMAALEPLKAEMGLKTLDHYQALGDASDMISMTKRFPAVYVTGSELVIENRNRRDEMGLSALIHVCDRNVRGVGAAERGGGGSPGCYELLKAIRNRLHWVKGVMPKGWLPLYCLGEEAVTIDLKNGAAVYAAVYTTRTPHFGG